MKRIISILIFCSFLPTIAQVGIGTETPHADLDVKGSVLVRNNLILGKLKTVDSTDEDFRLLTRVTNSDPVGEITVLNVDSLTVAPINVVNYKFEGIKLDNLTNVNLQYDASKYIVALSNFRYVGDPIKKKTITNNEKSIGAFVYRVFVENEEWHLEIRNRFLDLEANAPNGIEYYVTLIIYDKAYYRHLPVIVTNLEGQNQGTASSVPSL